MKGSVRKRGEKWSYYFTYKQDGKYKKKEKGGFKTKKEAQMALRDALQIYEKQSVIQNNDSYTVEEFFNYWKENVAIHQLRHNTVILYERYFNKHIKNQLGSVKLDSLSPTVLQKYFSQKQNELSASGIRTLRNVWSSFLKLAVKQNILYTNPLQNIELSFKRIEVTGSPLDQDILEKFMDYIKDTDYYLAFFISSQTGLRRGEVLGLTWEDIDFENNTLTINKALSKLNRSKLVLAEPKTASSNRTILMTRVLVDKLKEYKSIQENLKQQYGEYYYTQHDFVCCREDGRPINPDTLSTVMGRFSKEFGVNIKFHAVRHTHATNLLESDVNIKVIQSRLGHSNISTTLDIYSHVTNAMEEESIKRFEDKFNK